MSNIISIWKIVRQVVSNCSNDLLPVMSYPCGEQYSCLSLLDKSTRKINVQINMQGNHICVNDSILDYENIRSEKKIHQLALQIIRTANFEEARVRRDLSFFDFVITILNEVKSNDLMVANAWYDGSHHCCVTREAEGFEFYKCHDSDNPDNHLPWWTISFKGDTVAICNSVTSELILNTSLVFNYVVEFEAAVKALAKVINKSEFLSTMRETIELLKNNREWEERYSKYSKEIIISKDYITMVRAQFREWDPFKIYLDISNAKKSSGKIKFDLRYLGQRVAELNWKNRSFFIDTTKDWKKNYREFGCSVFLENCDWKGNEARAFRNFFKSLASSGKPLVNEHRLESLLITEFRKKSAKVLSNIKPVDINGIRFPMPTPLKASNHSTISYSGNKGGGIDILTRFGSGGYATNLCVIELKDENKAAEPPKDAIMQAIAYATFLRMLLRSESGKEWWKIFGFKQVLPSKLVILACCAMPAGTLEDKSFANTELDLDGDVLRLHYIYFTEDDNSIKKIDTSLNSLENRV